MDFDRAAEDLGNIVELGHVNLRVPDQRPATLFYVSGLGLTRDPYLMAGVENMWINVGRSQFHLPTGPAQVLRGRVGLVLPDRGALLARLARVAPLLEGTAFAVAPGERVVDVTCPWGNRYCCHPPAPAFGPVVLGVAYAEFDVPMGVAAGIVRFYRELLGAPAVLDGRVARVPAGPGQELRYRETAAPLPPVSGEHVQISLADFAGPYERLRARGLVSEESDQHQYRFCDIVDLDSGAVLFTVEHEVRSMRHPLYARPLVNRDPALTNRNYRPGHDSFRWNRAPE